MNVIDEYNNGRPVTVQRLKSQEDESISKRKVDHQSIEIEVDEPITAVDNCIPCKLFLTIFLYFFLLGTILFMTFVSAMTPRAHSYCMCVSFFIAVGFGWFILNPLRIMFAACMTPGVVRSSRANKGRPSQCQDFCDCMFVSEAGKQMYVNMCTTIEEGEGFTPAMTTNKT